MYMRIGKSLASNGRFSQSELAECLDYDWEDDLEKFGSVDAMGERVQHLTREQYTLSLYELVDEWCGSVESTKLYEELLQLILDNSSVPLKDGVSIKLKPLRQVKCCFQQLVNMRSVYAKKSSERRVGSDIGTRESKLVSSLTGVVLASEASSCVEGGGLLHLPLLASLAITHPQAHSEMAVACAEQD